MWFLFSPWPIYIPSLPSLHLSSRSFSLSFSSSSPFCSSASAGIGSHLPADRYQTMCAFMSPRQHTPTQHILRASPQRSAEAENLSCLPRFFRYTRYCDKMLSRLVCKLAGKWMDLEVSLSSRWLVDWWEETDKCFQLLHNETENSDQLFGRKCMLLRLLICK